MGFCLKFRGAFIPPLHEMPIFPINPPPNNPPAPINPLAPIIPPSPINPPPIIFPKGPKLLLILDIIDIPSPRLLKISIPFGPLLLLDKISKLFNCEVLILLFINKTLGGPFLKISSPLNRVSKISSGDISENGIPSFSNPFLPILSYTLLLD